MKRTNYLLVFLTVISLQGFGQVSFHYKRNISGVHEPGWYAMSLPTDMFKHLNDQFTDLRLFSLAGTDTVELAYLLDVKDEEVTQRAVQLPVLNESRKDGILYVTFALRPAQRVNALDLGFEEPNYFAFVTVEGSDDRLEWYEIARDKRIVSVRSQHDDFALSSVDFPLADYRFLRVGIRSDVPLTFRRASFQYRDVRPGLYKDIPLGWKMHHDKKARRSFVDITLHDFTPVATINVRTDSAQDYYRHFRIEYVYDSTRTDKGWLKNYSPLYEGHLTSFRTNAFSFDWQTAKALRLVIDNQDNAPLKIVDVTGKGPEVHVIAFLKPGDNVMLYGAGDLRAPSYDLAHFQNKIPDAPMKAELSPEERLLPERIGAKPLFENKLWLWTLLIVMIGGLGFFTLRMMRQGAVHRS